MKGKRELVPVWILTRQKVEQVVPGLLLNGIGMEEDAPVFGNAWHPSSEQCGVDQACQKLQVAVCYVYVYGSI